MWVTYNSDDEAWKRIARIPIAWKFSQYRVVYKRTGWRKNWLLGSMGDLQIFMCFDAKSRPILNREYNVKILIKWILSLFMPHFKTFMYHLKQWQLICMTNIFDRARSLNFFFNKALKSPHWQKINSKRLVSYGGENLSSLVEKTSNIRQIIISKCSKFLSAFYNFYYFSAFVQNF